MATALDTDIAIIGSGIAGALAAAALAPTGARVLILEAGAPVDRLQAVETFWKAAIKVPECAYPSVPEAMHPTTDALTEWYRQDGPELFKSTYLKVVGGTTWHWLGTCVRLLPSDFELHSRYGHGTDWPISYDTLEPFYAQAENQIGVAGDSDHDLGSPRSTAFPLPPIPQSYLDKTFDRALQDTRFEVRATPQARNSIVYDQRPPCCGSSSCIPVCPIQAKYDATVHLKKALAAGAQLLDRSTVTRLEARTDGRIAAAHFRRWDQTSGVVRAKIFVVACHAIETPRLLLASRTDAYPDGIANRSGQVGRNLMDHPVQLSWALTREPVYPYRGPLSTSGIENLRDGSFRRDHGAYRIEIGNDGWGWPTGAPISTAEQLLNKGLSGTRLDQALAHETARHVRIAALLEQLPEPENRVTLGAERADIYGVPLPRISYRVDNYAKQGMARARQDLTEILERVGSSHIEHAPGYFGAGHIMGTARMGEDPAASVVDATLCSHDHRNLYILGSSVFPTGGTANPTLTIAALSLRAAQAIRAQLGD